MITKLIEREACTLTNCRPTIIIIIIIIIIATTMFMVLSS